MSFKDLTLPNLLDALIEIPSLKHPKTNISHLGKRKIIFTSALGKGYVSSLEGSVILKGIFEDDRAGQPLRVTTICSQKAKTKPTITTRTWQFFVTCLGWLSDLQLHNKKVTLHHLVYNDLPN